MRYRACACLQRPCHALYGNPAIAVVIAEKRPGFIKRSIEFNRMIDQIVLHDVSKLLAVRILYLSNKFHGLFGVAIDVSQDDFTVDANRNFHAVFLVRFFVAATRALTRDTPRCLSSTEKIAPCLSLLRIATSSSIVLSEARYQMFMWWYLEIR